jgi:hypothetical protein
MPLGRFVIGFVSLALIAPAAAHEGGSGDHLNIGYYYGHDGTYENPADPPWLPTLLVDTHPWELGDVLFDRLTPCSGLLTGWQSTIPGFDTLPVGEQEFGGHGFYSWLDGAYAHGPVQVMLHLEDHDDDLQILSPFTLQPLPETSYLGSDFHLHAVFFVDEGVGLEPADVLTATFHLSDANGNLQDSEAFTVRLSLPRCPEDLDQSGDVGVTDFLELLAQWDSNPGGPPDFDEDGTVGVTDFLHLLGVWGPCVGSGSGG